MSIWFQRLLSDYSVPWNEKVLLGYFAEVFFNIYIGSGYMLFNGTILLLFSSVCLHHLAFYKMFEHTLHQLDQPRNKRNDKKLLCELIRFHNTVKALVCFSSLFLSL